MTANGRALAAAVSAQARSSPMMTRRTTLMTRMRATNLSAVTRSTASSAQAAMMTRRTTPMTRMRATTTIRDSVKATAILGFPAPTLGLAFGAIAFRVIDARTCLEARAESVCDTTLTDLTVSLVNTANSATMDSNADAASGADGAPVVTHATAGSAMATAPAPKPPTPTPADVLRLMMSKTVFRGPRLSKLPEALRFDPNISPEGGFKSKLDAALCRPVYFDLLTSQIFTPEPL